MTAEPEQKKPKPIPYLVGLLDLLGYSQLVEEFQHDPSVIEGVESVLSGALKMMEKIKSARLGEHTGMWNVVAEKIRFRLISDTALITMPFVDLPRLSENVTASDNFAMWMESFLASVCLFCLVIAGKLGYFFRGGIILGQHYESNPCDSRNLFMFSQALVDANKLMQEEKKLGTPRILVGESVSKFFEQYGAKNPIREDGWIFDEGVATVLNLYNAIPQQPKREGTTAPLLEDIRKALLGGYEKHGSIDHIRPKYEWLIGYHNDQVTRKFNRPDLQVIV